MITNFPAIKKLLLASRTIAVVGLSPKDSRPSNRVARYLIDVGYEVIPVNPGQELILGRPCFPSLSAIGSAVDIVDVFRRSEEVGPIVEEAIRIGARAVWLQEGIINAQAAAIAENAGLLVVMDQCLKTMHHKLLAL